MLNTNLRNTAVNRNVPQVTFEIGYLTFDEICNRYPIRMNKPIYGPKGAPRIFTVVKRGSNLVRIAPLFTLLEPDSRFGDK